MVSGVEIHAYAINMVLGDLFLKTAPASVGLATIMALALVSTLAVWRLRAAWAAAIAGAVWLVYLLVVTTGFDHGLVMDAFYPPLALLGGFVATSIYGVSSERAQKVELARTFGKYVSNAVAKDIISAADQGRLALGGQEQEVTVAFADVRGFFHLAETTPPQVLVNALNAYLSAVIGVVLKYDGTINKFGGDSIMAIWNAPSPCGDHALIALTAAREIQRAVNRLQRTNPELPKMDFGIGVNTGRVIAGNMGSQDRLEYTVIGDAINIAARLTSHTLPGKVWLGSRTYELTHDVIEAHLLPPLEVKGRLEPLIAYELSETNSEECNK
jgi:adenylate cyclase